MKQIKPGYILAAILAISLTVVTAIVSCEKDFDSVEQTVLQNSTAKKGGRGNGNGNTASIPTSYQDSLYQACGLWLSDTGSWYPTVNVTNINPYLRNLPSSDTTSYSQLVIRFDVPVIPGKTISSYLLFANQCSGRPACSKMNGIYMSQVTAGTPYNSFYISIGTSWLNPYVPYYTGVICAVTTEGCMYLSQPFTFQPPRIL